MKNRRKKVPRQLQEMDDVVGVSGCGSRVVWGRTFRLEGERM